MLFEIAGFVAGVTGIGIAFWLLYQRDSHRVVQGIYGRGRGVPRG